MHLRRHHSKTEREGYRPVQRQLLLMRRAGLVPYGWIADGTRWMRKPASYSSLAAYFERSANFYRADVWSRQADYVEIWIEKDALAGVIYRVTQEYDVPLMVCRGYPSESFVYEAARNIIDIGKPAFIYYFGDHDPSGEHISENLEKKFRNFGARVTFQRVAVLRHQIEALKLQTRPTKTTDTRAAAFTAKHGEGSVELDAIDPRTLRAMVRECIERHVDPDQLAMVGHEEAIAREALRKLSETPFSRITELRP